MATVGVQGIPVSKVNFVNLAATVQTIPGQGARVLYALYVINTQAATTAYIQAFDVAAASGVTLGTTVPDLQISVLGATAAFFPIPSTAGVAFGNGIQLASTTLVSGSVGSANGVYVYALFA